MSTGILGLDDDELNLGISNPSSLYKTFNDASQQVNQRAAELRLGRPVEEKRPSVAAPKQEETAAISYQPLFGDIGAKPETQMAAQPKQAEGSIAYQPLFADLVPEKKPGMLSRLGSAIDSGITSLAGENKPEASKIDEQGLAQYKAEEAEQNALVAKRRLELGTDSKDRGYAMKMFDSAAAGFGSAVSGTLEWVGDSIGSDSIRSLAQAGKREAMALTPREQDTAQKLAGAAGSMLSFVAPGAGAVKGLELAGVGIKAARTAGAGFAALLESAGVAQETYEKAMSETGNKAHANEQAWKAATLNMPLNWAMNKVGLFGDTGSAAKQIGMTFLTEGTEEGAQNLITNKLGYKPVGEGFSEAAAIGGLAGGGFKGGMLSLDALFKDATPEQKEQILTSLQEDGAAARQSVYDAMMQDERTAAIIKNAGIESADDPRFQGLAVQIGKLDRQLAELDIKSAEEQEKIRKERGEDVQAAFGDTASTSVGVGTGATEPVIQRSSVTPNEETKTLEGDAKPALLNQEGSAVALSPEDMVSSQAGWQAIPLQIDGKAISNSFVSPKLAETFLYGPVNKETGKREGGFADSVDDAEFQIRQGKRSKEAGGGTFYFIESREKQAAAPAAPAPAAPAKVDVKSVDTSNKNSAGFMPEPVAQVQAQVDAVADGRKPAAVTGKEESKKVNTKGLTKVTVKDPETGAESVVISKDKTIGAKVQKRIKKVGFKQAMGETLGYVEPTATSEPAAGNVVVQQIDNKSGEAIQDQIVSAENVDKVPAIEGTTKEVKTVKEGAAKRQQEVKQEAEPVVEEEAKPAVVSKPKAEIDTSEKPAASKPKAAKPKAEKSSEPKAEKPNAKQIKLEAIDSWEDNDDGVTPHIPFNKLTKEKQNDWIAAYAPEDGVKPYSSAEYHDQIVRSSLRDERARRVNKLAEENRAKASMDGVFRVTTVGDTGMSKAAVDKIVEDMVAKWSRLPEIKVVETEDDLPIRALTAIKKKGMDNKVPGLFFNNKVWLVAGNMHNAEDAILTVAHEITGHFGMRSLFGENHADVMMSIYEGNAEVRKLADAMDVKEGLGKAIAVEEVLADMAEKDPADLKVAEKSALRKLYEAVRAWLRDKFGIKFVSDEDVRQIVANARAYVIEGKGEMGKGGTEAAAKSVKDAMAARAGAPTFYSAMERAFRAAKMEKMPAEQWKSWLGKYDKQGNYISNIKGVKSEEVLWTGINEWLDAQDGRVTKEQILTWIAGNRVHVNDIMLTSYGRPDAEDVPVAEIKEPDAEDMRSYINDKMDEAMDNGEEMDDEYLSLDDMSEAELRDYIAQNFGWQNFLYQHRRDMERFQRGRVSKMTKPKHGDGSLVLPGGKSYAELVLFDPTIEEYNKTDDVHFGDVSKGKAIGWLRMNERKDTQGNTVLFLEEIQSQRAQHGREDGFAKEKGQVARRQSIKEKIFDLEEQWDEIDSDLMDIEFSPEEQSAKENKQAELKKEIKALQKEMSEIEDAVPLAPFVSETRSWTALLLKRAIAYAQSRGIDRIVWTTGEQQNERYKFPGDELVYVKEKGGDKFTLSIMRKGKEIRTVNDIPASKLSAYVGARAAERIGAGEGVQLDNEIEFSGSLKGDDLAVMEANLQPFYNQTVPSVAKEILKGFDGSVEVMTVEGTGQQLGFVIPEKLQKTVEEDGLPLFRAREYEAQFADLPANVRAMAIAKGHVSPPTIRERLEALKPNMWLRVVQGTFDKFRSVKDIDLKAYMQLRLSNSLQDGAVSGLLHYGQVFDDDGALNIKKDTKGLLEVLKDVGPEVDRFLLWIAANRAGELKKQDRENFFTDEEISALKRLNLGTMKDGKSRVATYIKTLQGMNELNRSVLDVAKQTGLIDGDAYKKFAADIWYIPFYRQMDDDRSLSAAQTTSGHVSQYLSKTLKGSSRGVNDLMENVLMNWSHILSASMKNKAAVATLDAATQMNGIVTKLQTVDSEFGKAPNGEMIPLKHTVKVMENGKPVHYEINDEFLLASLDAVATMGGSNMLLDVARQFKTTLTRFISLSPTFKINNLIRDSVQSLALSDNGKNPIANAIQGYRAYKEDRASALVGGGLFAMGNAFDGDQAANVKRLLKTGVKTQDVLTTTEKAKAWFGKYQDKYDEVSDAMENANRIALYNKMRSNGATHLEAAYAARDLQDFSLQGNWATIRYASQVLPYFNARLQGLYKIGRDGIDPVRSVMFGNPTDSERQKAAKFGVVLGAVTAVELALYLSQMDDDDWKKREEWDKDAFYWFKVGDVAVRIPKPFELGAIGTAIGRATEQFVDSGVEGKVFSQRMLALLHDNFAINPVPQIVRPIYDLSRNKDGFTDRPIESMGMERLSKENRVNPTTSSVAVGLAKINQMFAEAASAVTGANAQNLQLSPIQMDYMLRGYLGWVGTVMQQSGDFLLSPLKPGESPDKRIDDIPVVGNYIKSLPQSQSKYVTSFYENAKEIATAASDYRMYLNAGETAKAAELMSEKRDLITLNKAYSQTADTLAKIGKRIKMVQENEQMDGTAKRIEIDRLNALKSELAKRAEEMRISRSRLN